MKLRQGFGHAIRVPPTAGAPSPLGRHHYVAVRCRWIANQRDCGPSSCWWMTNQGHGVTPMISCLSTHCSRPNDGDLLPPTFHCSHVAFMNSLPGPDCTSTYDCLGGYNSIELDLTWKMGLSAGLLFIETFLLELYGPTHQLIAGLKRRC